MKYIVILKKKKIRLDFDNEMTKEYIKENILKEIRSNRILCNMNIKKLYLYYRIHDLIKEKKIINVNNYLIEEKIYKNIYNPINKTCPISLNLFENNEKVIKSIKCSHIYTSEYIKKWLENNNTCPLCRIIIKIDDNNWIIGEGYDELNDANYSYRFKKNDYDIFQAFRYIIDFDIRYNYSKIGYKVY